MWVYCNPFNMTGVLHTTKSSGLRHKQKKYHVKTKGEDGCLRANPKEKVDKSSPADTFTLDCLQNHEKIISVV